MLLVIIPQSWSVVNYFTDFKLLIINSFTVLSENILIILYPAKSVPDGFSFFFINNTSFILLLTIYAFFILICNVYYN